MGLPVAAGAQVPWRINPPWSTPNTGNNNTGCAIDDVDGDQWLDLAVSNGNDIVQAPNYVYHSTMGDLPTTPTWESDDLRYSGHCALGDLDGDGLPELAVSNYINPGWAAADVQVYGNGVAGLETLPGWVGTPALHTFRCAMGDPDGDGDLDLAVASGEAYNGYNERNRIYFNDGGMLTTAPGWTSDLMDTCYDVRFVDIDADGDQDLAFLGGGSGRPYIHFNDEGVVATSPAWQAADTDNGNTFDFGDVDGDGFLDMAVAYNIQLGGSGYYVVHYSDGGTLRTTPDWQSADNGYGSLVKFADVDADGDLDLIAGRWWGRVSVYLNDGGTYPGLPNWRCAPDWSSVIESVALADLDGGAEEEFTRAFTPADGRLLDLDRRHLQGIDEVRVDGEALPRTAWCASREDGWVSLGVTPRESAEVTFRASDELDLAVTNWDGLTFIFEYDPSTPVPEPSLAGLPVRHSAYPNPFNPRTTIAFTLPRAAHVRLDVHDVRGLRVATLADEELGAGEHRRTFDATDLASGLYVYRLMVDGQPKVGKMQLVR
jgi:hypothetical protein